MGSFELELTAIHLGGDCFSFRTELPPLTGDHIVLFLKLLEPLHFGNVSPVVKLTEGCVEGVELAAVPGEEMQEPGR